MIFKKSLSKDVSTMVFVQNDLNISLENSNKINKSFLFFKRFLGWLGRF